MKSSSRNSVITHVFRLDLPRDYHVSPYAIRQINASVYFINREPDNRNSILITVLCTELILPNDKINNTQINYSETLNVTSKNSIL